MITFSKLGKHGNLGNQLFQLASMTGFMEKYGCEMVVPQWSYAQYFLQPPKIENFVPDLLVEEPFYHYTPAFWDAYADDFREKKVDILGWMQSEKYWQHCNEKVRLMFGFHQQLIDRINTIYRKALSKETIAISIRRGDFATHPGFYLLPLEYYLQALFVYFPQWRSQHIIVFSDDFVFCETYIRHLPNVFFASRSSAIEQLCLMSMCDHFIISNSSFSWWGAWLGEKSHSIIVRSPFQLAGEMLKTFDNRDYYPERWMAYDHTTASPDIKGLRNPTYAVKIKRIKNKANRLFKKLTG